MNVYSIALFLHIVGALGFSVVLGLEWIGLWHIRSATQPEPVYVWMGIFKSSNRLGILSMLTTIITGLYMLLAFWRGAAWIYVVLVALVLEIVLFVTLTGPRMAAIGQALVAEKRPISQTFHNLADHPMLWISVQTRVAIILAIVLLKIAKPDLGGSLLTVAIAIVLGLGSALPIPRRERAQAGSAD